MSSLFTTCANGHPLLKNRYCDGLPDCIDGSDEGEDCLGIFGCCMGTFDITEWTGSAHSQLSDLEYAGFDESTGRPWFKNDIVTITYNSYYGDSNLCDTMPPANKYWVILLKSFDNVPTCKEFSNSLNNGEFLNFYLVNNNIIANNVNVLISR